MPSLKKHGMRGSILDEQSNGQTAVGGLLMIIEVRTRMADADCNSTIFAVYFIPQLSPATLHQPVAFILKPRQRRLAYCLGRLKIYSYSKFVVATWLLSC
jgi:hypothetical protein